MDTPDSYRERLKTLFETSSWLLSDSKEEVARIQNALEYKGDPLYLYQYRRVSKESIYTFISGLQTLTAPNRFNDIFDSFPYCNKEYFKNSILNLNVRRFRELINIARNRVFTQDEERELGSSISIEIVRRLSQASHEDVEEYLARVEEGKQKGWETFCERATTIAKVLPRGIRVACLSELYDSPAMWGHYADSGRGFCLRYYVKPFYKCDFCLEHAWLSTDPNCKNKGRLSLLPVIYTDTRFNCAKLIEMRFDNHIADVLEIDPDFSKYDRLEQFKLSCFKGRSWSYEREWRLILEGAVGVPDYYNARVLFPDAIYLGPKISQDDEAFLVRIANALQTPTGHPLEVYKMSVDWEEANYTLTAHKYPEPEKQSS